ncbi:MAG: hypothetical protein KGL73_01260 [Burkholderiales bacterium]|nr:hypothetical protein [Burkholderiales bacterium]
MNRYLFLDFDGVLHTSEPPRDLRFAKYLVPIVAELELQVVISSTWREVYSVQAMAQKLGDLGRFVIDKTPVWPSEDLPETGGRQKEIEAWLAESATSAAAWVALDDDRDNYRSSCNRAFITDKTVGLNAEMARQFARWCESRF